MSSWKVLALVILALLQIFNSVIATPVGSEHYSVEEQDPAEQTVHETVDDEKDYGNDKLYELQLAVWPEDDPAEPHQVMTVDANAPVYEEQEIAYPVLTPEHEDDGHVVSHVPTWQHTTTTERPIMQEIPVWQQPQTTKTPVHVSTTWQHVPNTERPTPQEIPIWHNPQHNVKPQQTEVVNVPGWQQPEPSVSASVVPLTPVPVPAPPTSQQPSLQNEKPIQVFPDIHFDEAEAIADQQDNADVMNDHFLISGIQGILSKPRPTKRPVPQVEVIEQYQVVNPNGTTEYKLVLSNGMTNYKKIYNKLLPTGKIVTVQEGYDSVPIPGDDPYSNDYQTQYYIADEFGHNVYKVEKHTRRPKLPSHLDYKEQAGQF